MSDLKPILFNTDMVRAIFDGRKTVTRRVVKPRYREDEGGFQVCTNKATGERWIEKCDWDEGSFDTPRYVNPPYRPGDILYVRETWTILLGHYIYKADQKPGMKAPGKWHPSIHMPKDAARIFLRVTGVRVERLRSISAYDVRKEGIGPQGTAKGCKFCGPGFPHYPDCDYAHCDNYKGLITQNYTLSFIALWELTTKSKDRDRYGWAANPWVWVIEFERCKRPEVEHGEEKAAD